MIRVAPGLVVVGISLAACTSESATSSAVSEVPAGAERTDWTLMSINGAEVDLPEWASGRRGEILAWSEGDTVQFYAGCGFSISTRTQPVVVRQAAPVSRSCSAQDIALLQRLESIAADRAQVTFVSDRMTLASAGGDTVTFARDHQTLYPD